MGEGFHVDAIGDFNESTVTAIETNSDATTTDKYLYLIEDDNRVDKTSPLNVIDLSGHLVSYDGIQWYDYGQMGGVQGPAGSDGMDGRASQD